MSSLDNNASRMNVRRLDPQPFNWKEPLHALQVLSGQVPTCMKQMWIQIKQQKNKEQLGSKEQQRCLATIRKVAFHGKTCPAFKEDARISSFPRCLWKQRLNIYWKELLASAL